MTDVCPTCNGNAMDMPCPYGLHERPTNCIASELVYPELRVLSPGEERLLNEALQQQINPCYNEGSE